jgi:uncharacterized membrane protein
MPAMGRLTFIDGLRGVALILMVLNHTSRDWMDGPVMGWARYYLVYGSLILPAAIFLFLVGFSLPIGYHRRQVDEPLATRAQRYFRRGIGIVAGGYLLNVLLASELAEGKLLKLLTHPEQPLWNGGVLQTIGLAVILLGPALPLLRSARARWMLVGGAVLWYLTFVAAVPALKAWTWEHPLGSRALFNDFPPWPWLSPAVLGLVVGWTWLEARARGAAAEQTFFVRVALIGAACVAAYLVWELLIPTTPRFGFPRDFSLNRHWTPRGMTTVLIVGGVAILLSLMYWLMERRRMALPWLVVLGQTALMLYFTHQLIEWTLINKILGLRFNNWAIYWVANVVFVVLLVYMGKAWQAIKARAKTA